MERHQFDDSWREAFAGGEVSPDEAVWTRIELGLANAEKAGMRKRIIFYQRTAAGLALVLVAGAAAFYFASGEEAENKLASAQKQPQAAVATPDAATVPSGRRPMAVTGDSTGSKAATGSSQATRALSPGNTDRVSSSHPFTAAGIRPENTVTAEQGRRDHHPLVTLKIGTDRVAIREKMRAVELVRQLPAMPASFMASGNTEQSNGEIWASLGAAAGGYNPNGQSGVVAETNSAGGFTTTSSRRLSTGSAYSFGLNAGKRIGRRWVLQTGINYINQSVDYQSNVAALDAGNQPLAYASEFDASLSKGSFRITAPYPVTNAIEIVSIPVQAGWMVVDRRFGLQLNSGISTDLFLRSTLIDNSGRFDNFSQGSGSDSPIRPVNFSGLFSTELSYKLGGHYGVALVPGFRYSLAPLSKPGEGNLGNALIWDIGFRLRYHFR